MKRGSAITIPNFIYSHISLFYKYLIIVIYTAFPKIRKELIRLIYYSASALFFNINKFNLFLRFGNAFCNVGIIISQAEIKANK